MYGKFAKEIIMKHKTRHKTRYKVLSMFLSLAILLSLLSTGFFSVSADNGDATLDIRKEYVGSRSEPFSIIVHDYDIEPVDLDAIGITLWIKLDNYSWEPYIEYFNNHYSGFRFPTLEHGELMIPASHTVRIEGLDPGEYHLFEDESETVYNIEYLVCEGWDDANDTTRIYCPGEAHSCVEGNHRGGKEKTTDPDDPIMLAADKVTRVCFHNEESGGAGIGVGPYIVESQYITFTKSVISADTVPDTTFRFHITKNSGPDDFTIIASVDNVDIDGTGDYEVQVHIEFSDLVPNETYVFTIWEDASGLDAGWTPDGQYIYLTITSDYHGIFNVVWHNYDGETIVNTYVDPNPSPPAYPYKVKYYKDSVTAGNLVGEEEGISEFVVDYQLLESSVAGDLGGTWRNIHRPGGYKAGVVQGSYPVITVDVENNVVIVLYLPEDSPGNNPLGNNPPGNNPPGNNPPGNNPPDNNPPDDDSSDDDLSDDDLSDDDSSGNDPSGSNTPSHTPPTQIVGPGGTNRAMTPNPNVPGRELIPDGDTFIEFDEYGVPLGSWIWDHDEEMWFFDEFVPLSRLPQTGVESSLSFYLLMFGFFLASIGVLLRRIKLIRHIH